jgi:acyl-CoA thioesterase-1
MKPRTFWLKILACLATLPVISSLSATSAYAATVVALGASNTYGKGVARN